MMGTMKSNATSRCQDRVEIAIHRCAAWVALVAAACGRDGASPAPAAAATAISTQLVSADPCRLVTAAEVAELVDRPTRGVPVRVSSAESVTPSSSGTACLYELAPERGQEPGLISLEVRVDGVEMEAGLSGSRTNQWDWVSTASPGLFAARRGHVGILIAFHAPSLPSSRVELLATRAFERLPDVPFAIDSADASIVGSDPDPCTLISNVDVERELRPLAFAPFRSRESTPIVHGAGASCTFYATGHRAIVITPTARDGKARFAAARGIVRRPGEWDAHAVGPTGTLYFLKGDRMLELHYRASSIDEEAAVRLATSVFPRL
jgi:hypothetical protein